MIRKQLVVVVAIVLLSAAAGHAQSAGAASPGAILKQSTDTLEYYLQRKKVEEKKAPVPGEKVVETPPEKEKAAPTDDRKIIYVEKIETDPSKILTAEELEAIIGPYTKRQVSIQDLFRVVDSINALYKEKKYITARAILPAQKVVGGVVKIQLIESHVGQVVVENNESTRASYILKRISLTPGDLLRPETLEQEIVYLNAISDVKVRAELKPGKAFGTTDTVLKVLEPPQFDASVFYDNAGRSSVGENRVGTFLTNRSVFGQRDPLTLSVLAASGTFSGFATYNAPISASGTRLGAAYNFNQTDVSSGPLKPLEIGGDAFDFSVSLSQPLVADAARKYTGFIEYHHKGARTTFSDVTLTDVKVDTYGFGATYQMFDAYGVWDSVLTATYGTDTVGKGRDFWRFNLNTIRLFSFRNDVVAILRGGGQIANADLLPASEQFQIGGISTVRGYPEGYLLGDDGYLVSAEVTFPLIRYLKGAVFFDHGGAFPYKGGGESYDDQDFLTGAGFGLNLELPKYLSGRAYVAWPIGGRQEKIDDVRFHFFVQARF